MVDDMSMSVISVELEHLVCLAQCFENSTHGLESHYTK